MFSEYQDSSLLRVGSGVGSTKRQDLSGINETLVRTSVSSNNFMLRREKFNSLTRMREM